MITTLKSGRRYHLCWMALLDNGFGTTHGHSSTSDSQIPSCEQHPTPSMSSQ
ncbi:unnamed protein product [Rhodiola kirilowii]